MSIRLNREFLPHIRQMSGNATKLFVWLLLSAYRSGPKRGCVEANIEDIMHGCHWTRSTAKRSLEELASKDYIRFRGAANQHSPGLIRICKLDVKEAAQLTSEPSTEPSSEPSNSTNSRGQQDLQALRIASLPARNADFAHLAEVNPRLGTEDLRGWAERLLCLSNGLNIFFPRQVFARARDAA